MIKIRKKMYKLGVTLSGHKNILTYMKLLEKNRKFSQKQIEQWQLRRVNELLKHAYETTEYYKNIIGKAKIILPIKSMNELKKLPILTKKDIQKNTQVLCSNKYTKKELIKNSTGGSTGKPLVFYQNKDYFDFAVAYQNYNFTRMGWCIGKKIAYIWGSEKDYSIRRVRDKINDIILRRKYINTFAATELEYIKFAQQLMRFKPEILVGYASSLLLFAQVLEKNNITKIQPKAVQSGAETLTQQNRKYIEKILKTTVYNNYGSREVGSIAHECKKQEGLHESWMMNYVEIVNNKIIITNLWNFAMPFIRYEIGDIAQGFTKRQCSCKNHSKKISEIQGRVSDIIKAPNDKRVHGEYFTHLFYSQPNIKQFQVLQENKNLLQIKLVATKKEKRLEDWIVKKIHKEIDNAFNIKFKYVKEIPIEKSGKYRFTISKI